MHRGRRDDRSQLSHCCPALYRNLLPERDGTPMSTVTTPVRRGAAAHASTDHRSRESPTATNDPPGPGGGERRPPPFREGFVSRPRLVATLIASADVPVTLIAAPGGYGKTTLLAEWARL